jgi:preprotein translocase subunit SecA
MFQAVLSKFIGTRHEREMRRMQPMVARINELEPSIQPLSDDDLQAKTAAFRQRIEKGEPLDRLLPEAFAVCREASRRCMGMRHYDVQLIGGMVLHSGTVAEMRTGEGKTLTATLAMYLNALAGKGAHLVTVNDYLAARDAEWMGRLYGYLGLTTGTIVAGKSDTERRDAYLCDITYGTNNEFGFDYLRDNMKYDLDKRVQRELHYAIVDEVDSILIDEARTPLIISGQDRLNAEMYIRINDIISTLRRDEDYVVDEEHRSATLSEEGVEKVEAALELDNLFEPVNVEYVHHLQKALEAHTLYKRDEQYMVKDGKVVIIDEFTGRPMDGRRWSDGLHQAVEAKEGVRIQAESITLATITYQNFFRMYGKLAGMTGTADTEAEELKKIYNVEVTVIPTNKPVIRQDHADLVYRTEREKFAAIIDQIVQCNERGQPVLVGTVSVDKSEVISKILKKKKIAHSVLNAKFHGQEASIVAQAGRKGSVTIATNMAGRGTDIVLGGNPEALAAELSPDPESDDYRTALSNFRTLCERERDEVLQAGGLFILGTERHESRRIDNQLRGRAGRQGDPGASRFFLSLEDDLMRRFGADKIQGLMARLGMEEGVPIEAGMVSRSIENAQKRVEGRNFDIRKHLLEYDDVMDVQRKAIYGLRQQILAGENIPELVLDALDDALASILDTYASEQIRIDDWDFVRLANEVKDVFGFEVDPEELPLARRGLESLLWDRVSALHRAKIDELEPIAARHNEKLPEGDPDRKTAADVFHDISRDTYLRELDRLWRDHLGAMRSLRDSVSLHGYAQKDPKYTYKKEGFALFTTLRRSICINVARDLLRMVVKKQESLEQANSERRSGVTGAVPALDVAALQQKAVALRDALARATRENTAVGGDAPAGDGSGVSASIIDAPRSRRRDRARTTQSAAAIDAPTRRTGALDLTPDTAASALPGLTTTGSDAEPKVRLGRNEPCWCGSGKKYKHCHMRSDVEGESAP